MIDFERYFVKFYAPLDIDAFNKFENEKQIALPVQYRSLMLMSNGADVRQGCIYPPNLPWEDVVTDFFSLDIVKSSLNIWQDQHNQGNIFLEHQDKILGISCTMTGYGVHIGVRGELTGKIYIDRTEDIYESEGKNIIPIYLVANSLAGFLEILEPFREG